MGWGGGILVLARNRVRSVSVDARSLVSGCELLCLDVNSDLGFELVVVHRPSTWCENWRNF